jgi:two-component system, NtrC family, nitrogen regulation sensor histidine kinase NtrY
MIHIIKNYKWVLTSSLICIIFGLLTFFTFINQSFINLNNFNLQVLLIIDLFLLLMFVSLVIYQTYKTLIDRKKKKLGSETGLRYIVFFSGTTLIPSILIAIFSLILFNVGLQKYFDKKIKDVINDSAEVAKNYVEQTRNSIESDIILVYQDINTKSGLFYDYPSRFFKLLASQRMLRRLDEVHIIDSSSNIIVSSVIDTSNNFVPPPEEAFTRSLNGKPIRIIDPSTNRTSALVKLDNFIDTYLYIVKFMDPKLINYLNRTDEAVSFYYSVQENRTGIKITFGVIYLLIVSLLLFLSITISINFATRLTLPIINLIGASEKISAGDLNAKVPLIETDKEFQKLNENFNLMIDKLKKQQDKLLTTERHEAWESVARKLAHEIKNPLTPIQLSIDRIREKYLIKIDDKDNRFSNYLVTITKQIKVIENLLNEFSDFARMPKPVLKKIDLTMLVSRVLNLHNSSATDTKFIFNKKNSSCMLLCDEEQFNRVLINLIKNSIESIDEKKTKNANFKGIISIEINDDSDYIYLNILDNGVGFNETNKIKMITPYFTTKKKGTGLGLAIVTKIISDHNGTILFNSWDDGAKVEIIMPKKYD